MMMDSKKDIGHDGLQAAKNDKRLLLSSFGSECFEG
jgi:hypothetical protein